MEAADMLFTKLLLAHLLGDFLLQTGTWIQKKETHGLKSYHLYVHAAIHMALPLLFTWEIRFWPYAMAIGMSHFLIDLLKSAKNNQKPLKWFITDQVLHLMVLLIIVLYYTGQLNQVIPFFSSLPWKIVTGYFFITLPTSIIIKHIISPWQPKDENNKEYGVINAGKFIGIIERVLILIFLSFGQWQAIGFLLTAKSVFRFKDMNNTRKEIPLTEYILLGTFLSFGFAIATGLFLYSTS